LVAESVGDVVEIEDAIDNVDVVDAVEFAGPARAIPLYATFTVLNIVDKKSMVISLIIRETFSKLYSNCLTLLVRDLAASLYRSGQC
jgi:hypothetical protein